MTITSLDRFHTFNAPLLKNGERVDDLQIAGFGIIQRCDSFRFGTDSVLLSDFALCKRNRRVVDLGAGSGVISVLMAAHDETLSFDMIEIQPDVADMARRTVDMNALGDRAFVHCLDMRDAAKTLGYGAYDLAVCNPPYSRIGTAIEPSAENKLVSRFEREITLSEICQIASSLLKSGGRFATVFPAQRLFELMTAMDGSRLAPKRARLVYATEKHAPKLALLDAVKHGGSQLHWLPPLILKNPDGTPSDEWKRIYGVLPSQLT